MIITLVKRTALAVFFAATASTAHATLIVAPGAAAAVEGDSNNCFPFTCGAQRYQQVYDSSIFGGATGAITEIRFRVEDGYSSFINQPFDLLVRLSHTTATPATLSTTFASNIGADETTVLSGNIALSGTGGSGPNPFDIVLDVNDIFTYNGIGNLLLDITMFSGIAGPQFDSVQSVGAGLMQRVWSTTGNSSATSGNIAGDIGLVTQFNIGGTNGIPEPTTLALLGFGLAGLAASRRRKH